MRTFSDLAGSPRTTVSVPSISPAVRYYCCSGGEPPPCPSHCPAEPCRHTTERVSFTSHFPSRPRSCLRGKDIWRKTASPSKAKSTGHWAAKAFISAIRTNTSSSWPPRASGPSTESGTRRGHLMSCPASKHVRFRASGFRSTASAVLGQEPRAGRAVQFLSCLSRPRNSFLLCRRPLPFAFYLLLLIRQAFAERAANQNVSHYAKNNER